MNQTLKEIDRRAFRHDMGDGLSEMAMALFFLVPAITVGNPALSWMIILPILAFGPVIKRIRARHIYSRVGFVKPQGEKSAELVRGMALYAVGAGAAIAAGVFVLKGQITPGLVRQVSPLLASLLLGGGVLYAAGRSGLRRYYLLFGISVVLGLGLVFIRLPGRYQGLQIYLLVMAVFLFASRLATFLHFLRTHPVRETGEVEIAG